MTVKGSVNSVPEEDNIPDIIKHKLENLRTEARLINNKPIKLGKNIVVISKNIAAKRLLKISVQIINHASLSIEPIIPQRGRLLTDIFQIDILSSKGEILPKSELNISYKIKCDNIDNYCYPLIFESQQWKILKEYEIENEFIKINNGTFDLLTIVKEPPNEIINITPSGGLLYTKLDSLISLRVTKGNFKEEVMCKIQINDMPMENLDQFKVIRDNDLSPYLNISNMFVIGFSDPDLHLVNQTSDFRRPITMRLPLPDWIIAILEEQNFDSKNIIKDQKKEKPGFYFLHKSNDEWNFVESNLKFTKNSIEFDTKRFGSFLFVKCRENRELKLCQNMNIVESLIQIGNGIILTFLWIKSNNWFLWIEIVPISKIKETRLKMESLGFIYVEQYYEPLKLEDSKNNSKYKRKFSRTELIQRKTFELLENIQFQLKISGEIEQVQNLQNNQINSKINNIENCDPSDDAPLSDSNTFDEFDKIGIKKKTQILEQQKQKIPFDISFHMNLSSSNFIAIPVKPIRRTVSEWESIVLTKIEQQSIYENRKQFQSQENQAFVSEHIESDIESDLVAPSSQESLKITRLNEQEKEFNFFSEIRLENVNSESEIKIPSQIFKFYIPVDQMKNYHKIKTKEEKQKVEAEIEALKIQKEEKQQIEKEILYHKQNVAVEDKPRTINYNRINGLSRPRFTNKIIEKEPKIISRRSFLALSSIIRQGLKLAVYLSIPDNAIAGIGFDALSQMTMNGSNNTTYKILILWKKMILYNKTTEKDYVEQLVYGLKSIGYDNIGELVYNKWMKQQEITVDECQRCLLQTIF